MPPQRSGRNANSKAADTSTTVSSGAAPKRSEKNKKDIKAEQTEVNNNIEKSIPKKGVTKETTTTSAKEVPVKRKLKEEDEDDEKEEAASDKKTVKKRKTKEEKGAETMPLAGRTLVSGLKRSVHIGAHVSAAGGMYTFCEDAKLRLT